jgi:hypothetical protein
MKCAGHMARIEEIKRIIQNFGRKALREEIAKIPMHRWEDNIKMDLWEWG